MTFVAKAEAVVTGEGTTPASEEEAPSPFAALDRPVLAYVCPAGAVGDEYAKLDEIVFKNEKVGIGAKAFRTVKITPEDADRDPILKDQGKEVPRLLLVDPSKERVAVLEKGKLKPGSLFGEMKTIAGRFYKESLEKVVKSHLKFLTEQDQLANEQKTLREKITRLEQDADAKASKKDLEAVQEELKAVEKQLADLAQQQKDLWTLTPKEGGEAA